MKKLSIYLSAIVMGAIMSACGEVGIETNISKNNEVEINITNLTLTGTYGQDFSFNFADEEFSEYVDDVESWDINKIEFQITSVQGDKFTLIDPNEGTGSLRMFQRNSGNRNTVIYSYAQPRIDLKLGAYDLITNSNNQIRTTEKYTLYDRNGGAVSSEFEFDPVVVDLMLTSLRDRQVVVFTVFLEGEFENANISMKLFVDVTAKTKLD